MNEPPLRLRKLTDSLDQLGIDAMLVTNETNVRYLSGFTGDSSYLLVDSDRTVILSDGRYETQIEAECAGLDAIIRPPHQLLAELLQSVLDGAGTTRVGIESDHVPLSLFRFLSEKCPSVRWGETRGVVESLRMIKDSDEIEITRQAVQIAQRAIQAMLPMLTSDWSERAIAHELESKMRLLGAEGCSFPPIVAAGPAGALPHYCPGGDAIGDASSLLIDWGASFRGYASDLTRTLHRQTATDRFRRAYDAVLESQLAAIEAIRPGVAASDVDAAARGCLERHGLAEAFKHGLGHGTGLEIHESPRLSSASDEVLQSGMIITVEPGVYFEGDFGIRIEDDVLVTDTGHEVLSSIPKGLDDCRLIL